MKDRFAAIDGLRGVAILWVTLYHLFKFVHDPHPAIAWIVPFVNTGSRGVSLFFALSGFCLFYPIAKKGSLSIDLKNFWLRRILRIYPAFLLSLVVWFSIRYGLQHKSMADFWHQLLTHITFTYGFFPSAYSAVNGVWWSLAVEDHFYIILPALAYCLLRWPIKTFLVLVGVTVTYNLLVHQLHLPTTGSTLLYVNRILPRYIHEFAGGMLVAYLYTQRPTMSRSTVNVCAALGLFTMFAWPYLPNLIHSNDTLAIMALIRSFVPYWSIFVLSVMYSPTGLMTRFLESKPLVWLGTISYSAYLYNYAFHLNTWTVAGSAVWFLVSFVLVVGVGTIGYYLAEYPFLRLRERLRGRAQARQQVSTLEAHSPSHQPQPKVAVPDS